MNYKWIVLKLLLILGATYSARAQSHLTLTKQNGTEKSVAISEVQSFSFHGGAVIVKKDIGIMTPFPASQLRSLKFTTPTAVADINVASSSFVLSPVPAKEYVNVQATSENQGVVLVKLISVQGQTVLSQTQSMAAGYNSFTLNVSGLTSGIYVCQLLNAGTVTSQKLIIE